MKYVLIVFLLASHISFSQIHLPELSPEATVREKVGYTTLTIRYGRPAARGRKIFGDLVPYGKLWRTGAGKCSMIAFDTPVMIGDKKLSYGAYALVTIPGKNEWTVLLNSDTSKIYGDPSEYDVTSEAVSFKVASTSVNFHESLTVSVDIVKYDAILSLAWEQTSISFPIKTFSYEKSLAEIKQAIERKPKDAETLSHAAWFYYMNNEDPQQMLAWIDVALESGEDRWILRQRFEVLERMKDYTEAAKTAGRAIRYLERTKPVSWEESILDYQERMKRWPKKNSKRP